MRPHPRQPHIRAFERWRDVPASLPRRPQAHRGRRAVGPVPRPRDGARRRPARQGLIVELGPGTGPVTKALIARGVRRERLVLVEYDPCFCSLLAERFALTASSAATPTLCAHARRPLTQPVAAVVSSLPLLNEPPARRLDLLDDAFALMGPDGVFVQFTYGLSSPIPREACAGKYSARSARRCCATCRRRASGPIAGGAGQRRRPQDRHYRPGRADRRQIRGAAQGDGSHAQPPRRPGEVNAARAGAHEAARRRAFVAPRERLMVALDVASAQSRRRGVVAPRRQRHLLQSRDGADLWRRRPGLLRAADRPGQQVFIDLKLHDIPNTVERAVGSGRPARRDVPHRARLSAERMRAAVSTAARLPLDCSASRC